MENEPENAFADLQAVAVTNRLLLIKLYQLVLRGEPSADLKLQAISAELNALLDVPERPLASANMIRLVDNFLATVKQQVAE